MGYNRKLLFTKTFPSWSTPSGILGVFDPETTITPIQLSASESSPSAGGEIVYSLVSGALPVGLTISSDGQISGTLGNYDYAESISFSIGATDIEGETEERNFIIYIAGPIPVEYLVVAGGGAGGNGMGGGGGAGGLVHNYQGTPMGLNQGSTYSIVIGSGAPGTTSDVTVSGSSTSFSNINAIGGGGGSSLHMQRNNVTNNGANGGSGGGSGGSDPGTGLGGSALQPSSSSGGFGNAGGNQTGSSGNYPGGGGGGAGSAGESVSNSQGDGGDGGVGLQVDIDGNNYFWAGGGGGNAYTSGRAGDGGLGGGGGGSVRSSGVSEGIGGGSAINAGENGFRIDDSRGGDAGANTGGGGGGATWSSGRGGNGGSGVVILRMPAGTYSGTTTGSPIVSTVGSDVVLTYLNSGTYTA